MTFSMKKKKKKKKKISSSLQQVSTNNLPEKQKHRIKYRTSIKYEPLADKHT